MYACFVCILSKIKQLSSNSNHVNELNQCLVSRSFHTFPSTRIQNKFLWKFKILLNCLILYWLISHLRLFLSNNGKFNSIIDKRQQNSDIRSMHIFFLGGGGGSLLRSMIKPVSSFTYFFFKSWLTLNHFFSYATLRKHTAVHCTAEILLIRRKTLFNHSHALGKKPMYITI